MISGNARCIHSEEPHDVRRAVAEIDHDRVAVDHFDDTSTGVAAPSSSPSHEPPVDVAHTIASVMTARWTALARREMRLGSR